MSNVGLADDDSLFAKFSTTLQTTADPSCMAVADLNDDGLLDIAVGYSNNRNLDIFFQNSIGNFSKRNPSFLLPGNASALVAGDMDQDGLVDLVVGYETIVSILYQDMSFSSGWSRQLFNMIHGIVVSNFDNANKNDFAVLSSQDGSSGEGAIIDIFYEMGANDYSSLGFSITGMERPRNICLGDFNNDGYSDIVIADEKKGRVAAFINPKTRTFWTPVPQILISEPVGITIGKFDSSNLFELAIASRGTFTNYVEVWKFTSPTTPFAFIKNTGNVDGINGLVDYDMNSDAYRDIAISSNSTSKISVFNSPVNQGTAYPSTPLAIMPAGYEIVTMIGKDVNHDSIEDLVVSSMGKGSNGSISIYYRVGSGISNANDNVFPSATNQSGLVSGDYDADGTVEVGSLDNTARRLVFLENTGLIASYKTFGYSASRIVSGPLKTSTSSDIVVLHPDDNKVSIYFGGPTFFGSQTPSLIIGTGSNIPRSVALGDVTGDGRSDIVIGCHDGILILNNTGSSPYFASNKNITISQPGADFAWVGVRDYNNGAEEAGSKPKLNDIFGAYQNLNRIAIYYQQDQPIRFTPTENLILIPAASGKIVWAGTGRINNDGLSDLVIGLSTDRTVTYLQDNAYTKGFSDSSTTNKVSIASPYGFSQANIGDLNDDGFDELAIVGSKADLITAFAWKQGRHVPFTNMTTGAGRSLCMVSDVNGDERVDLIASSEGSGSVSFLYQRNMAPIAGFSVAPASLHEAEIATFDASSTTDGVSDTSSLSYAWLFDGTIAKTGKTVTYSFVFNSHYRTHTVKLTVQDRDGLSNVTSRTVTVEDVKPVANFYFSPSSPVEGQQIHFTDASSSATNSIVQWLWDFGDGSPSSSDRNPVHTFYFNHSYAVKLRVIETDGSMENCTKLVNMTDRDPQASFEATTGRYENTTVWFNETANPWFDHIDNWTWDFGDGSATVHTRNTSHVYSQNGTYSVTLTVVDNNSKASTVTSIVTVLDRFPILDFSFPDDVYENETRWVNFVSACYSLYPSGDPIVFWEWDFGDGFKNLSQAASHQFPLAGDHSVTLRLRDLDDRHTTNLTKTIHVISLAPTASIMPIEGTWIEGENVIHFTDLSTAYRLDPIVQWSWDFGDGSSSSDRNPDHSYQWAGNYEVGLTVMDSDGNHSTRTTTLVSIKHAIPTASVLVITPRPYAVGDTVTFQSTSSADPDHLVRLLWESDGDTGDQNVFRHQFNANSNFWVRLTVWSNDSIENMTVVFVNLDPSGVSIGTADGSTNNLYVEDTAVTFVVAATRSPADPIVSYVWDLSFGTGFVAQPPRTENSITWHFNQSGSYMVKVRVYDTNGYTEAHRQINIFESDPVPAFNCGNLNSEGPVWFNANQTHDTPSDVSLLRFRWNFGDSSPWSEWSSDATIRHTYPGDGNYTTIMQVKDDSGKIIPLSRSVVVDRSPPEIGISSPISKAFIGDPILVYANVTDLIGVEKVLLIYTIGNQTFEVEMTRANQAGSYVAEIPAQNRSVNLTYAISAVDVSGMQSPLSQSFQIVVSQRPTFDMMWAFVVLLLSFVSALLVYALVTKPVVDEVFVIYHDGSLLSHDTRHLKPGMDDQILGSMLIALQSFVKDSFKDETLTELKRMEFGEKRILVEREGPVFLAVILRGKRDGKATREMKYSLDGINHRFGGMLNPWDGDLEKVRGVKDMVKPLVKRKGLFRGK